MTQKQQIEEIAELSADFMQELIDLMFPHAEGAPWQEMNEAYAATEGSFEGTKFDGGENRGLRAMFNLQMACDAMTNLTKPEKDNDFDKE